MKEHPYVGGLEEKWMENNAPEIHGISETFIGRQRGRPFDTIRNEIILSAINYLEARLDNEQEGLMKNIKEICQSKSPKDFIDAARPILECTGITDVKEFADVVFETYDDFQPDVQILKKDLSVRILQMLR